MAGLDEDVEPTEYRLLREELGQYALNGDVEGLFSTLQSRIGELVRLHHNHRLRDRTYFLWDPFYVACRRGDLVMVNAILQRFPTGSDDRSQLVDMGLLTAANAGQSDVVTRLLPEITTNQVKADALRLAIRGDYLDIVKQILPRIGLIATLKTPAIKAIENRSSSAALIVDRIRELYKPNPRNAKTLGEILMAAAVRDPETLATLFVDFDWSPEQIQNLVEYIKRYGRFSTNDPALDDELTSVILPRLHASAAQEALHWAVHHHNDQLIVDLAAYHPNVIAPYVDEQLKKGKLDNVEYVAMATGAVSNNPDDLFLWAVAIGSESLVRYYLPRVNLNAGDLRDAAIETAATYGRNNIARWLQ